MAEGILQNKVQQLGLPITLDSAGTSNNHEGEAPDKRAIECMMNYAIDISHLRARPFEESDFDRFDLILAMDKENVRDILKLSRSEEDKAKVKLLLSYSRSEIDSGVPDPWYGDMDGFHEVYSMLDAATDNLIYEIRSQTTRKG